MEINTSSNNKVNNPQHETFSRLEAEFLGALEESAINFRDAEESTKIINYQRRNNGKQG